MREICNELFKLVSPMEKRSHGTITIRVRRWRTRRRTRMIKRGFGVRSSLRRRRESISERIIGRSSSGNAVSIMGRELEPNSVATEKVLRRRGKGTLSKVSALLFHDSVLTSVRQQTNDQSLPRQKENRQRSSVSSSTSFQIDLRRCRSAISSYSRIQHQYFVLGPFTQPFLVSLVAQFIPPSLASPVQLVHIPHTILSLWITHSTQITAESRLPLFVFPTFDISSIRRISR